MPSFLDYNLTQIITLVAVSSLIFAQHKKPEMLSLKKWLIPVILAALTASLLYRTYIQWEAFAGAPPAKYLLPPFAPWSYFIQYCWSWIWSQYLLAFGGALLIFCSITTAPKEWRDVRFEKFEPIILSLGLLLVGHPYWIFYFFGVVLTYLLYALVRAWRFPNSQRISFYNFYLPTALLVILLTPLLKTLPFMQVLAITL